MSDEINGSIDYADTLSGAIDYTESSIVNMPIYFDMGGYLLDDDSKYLLDDDNNNLTEV